MISGRNKIKINYYINETFNFTDINNTLLKLKNIIYIKI